MLAGLAGLVLGFVGGQAGPLAMMLLPAVVATLAAVFYRPAWAVTVVMLSLPAGLVVVPKIPLGLQVIQVAALTVSAVVVLARLVAGRLPVLWHRVLAWTLALLAWAFIATGSATDHAMALKQDANLVIGVLLAFVTVTVLRTSRQTHLAAGALLVGATLITVPSLRNAGQLRASFGGAVVADRLQGSFAQPNELGAFTMVVALVGCGLMLAARTARERLLVAAGLVPAVLALALSLSRGAWIGTSFGALAMFALLPAARRAVVLVGIPLLLAGGILASAAPQNTQIQVVGERLATVQHPQSSPYDQRPRIWAEGRREVRLDPWTGQGPGNFPIVSTRSSSGAQTVRAQHAHSALLTVAAEMGLPAAAFLVALTLAASWAVRDALRVLTPRPAAVLVGLAAACVGITGQGLIDYTYRNPVLFIVDWALLGLLLAGCAAAHRPASASSG